MNKRKLLEKIEDLKSSRVINEHVPLNDEEGGMALGELKTMADAANEISSMLQKNTQLEAWVQSKITKAKDYVVSVRDYLKSNPDAKE